jgi:hypothetical protein
MPFIIPLTYFFLLPHNSAFLYPSPSVHEDEISSGVLSALPYTPLAAVEDGDGEEEVALPAGPKRGVSLSASDKWRLVRPLLLKYMLPLCEISIVSLHVMVQLMTFQISLCLSSEFSPPLANHCLVLISNSSNTRSTKYF